MDGGWGDKLLDWLRDVYRRWYETLEQHPELMAFHPIVKVLYAFLPEDKPHNIPLFEVLLELPGLGDEARESIRQVISYAEKTSLPVNELVAVMVFPFLVQAYLGAATATATFPMARELRPSRPDPGSAWDAFFSGGVNRSQVESALRDLGWSEEWIGGLEAAARTYTDVSAAMDLYRRGELDQVEFYKRLGKLGFDDQAMLDYDSLKELIPGPGDLITMAVREAWRDDVAAKYGLDKDYVPDFGFWMEKQGYEEEWSKKWWRAHWRLPGISQAQEMLWRTDMTDDDFTEFLRFADIPETWRNWLSQIAYRTLTRVDIRRMHQMGVLTDDDLLKAYTDFGYNTENAANMAEFTIRYNTEEDRALTKADILKGYQLGILTPIEAGEALVALNYSAEAATYYLDLEDYHLESELTDEEVTVVQALYIAGDIDKPTATGRLSSLGLTAQRMALLFERWDVRREAKVERPSKGELELFVKQDIIDGPLYQSEMGKRGYESTYVQWYYASILLEQEQAARLEEERAAKEAERIRLAEEKSAYQSAKAELDYQIAQERLHYQQLKTAVTLYARREEVDELMATIVELQRDIAAIAVEIAGKDTAVRTAQATLRELGVPPELSDLYDQIDALNLQITQRGAEIADLRVAVAEGQASMRVVRLPTALVELNDIIASTRRQIAVEQDIISGLRVTMAEAQLELQRLEIPTEVQFIYAVVDQAQIEIAQQQATIADLKVALAEATIATRWEEPSTEVEDQRRIIDALEIDKREEQEDIAVIKLEIAEIKAQVESMMSSEEIAELEAEVAASQERIRELEIERARLKLS